MGFKVDSSKNFIFKEYERLKTLNLNIFEQTHIPGHSDAFRNSIFTLNIENNKNRSNKNLKSDSISPVYGKNALRVLESIEERETSVSYKKEISKSKYRRDHFSDFVTRATYKDNLIVFIPQNTIIGQILPIYEFGKAKDPTSERVVASITPEGVLRIAKGKYAAKNIINIIPGASLNFDNGIGLNQIRIKLSSGALVPVLSQIKK